MNLETIKIIGNEAIKTIAKAHKISECEVKGLIESTNDTICCEFAKLCAIGYEVAQKELSK